MFRERRLKELLDMLIRHGKLHDGQRKDILSRSQEQARHLLLDKREQLRRMMGRKRVIYELAAEELIESFRFRQMDQPQEFVNEDLMFRLIAQDMGLPFVVLDPLQLDYRLVTDSFGGPFAERHLIIAIDDGPNSLTIATAKPWDQETLRGIERVKGKAVEPVVTTKKDLLRIIADFHGFRRSMNAAEAMYSSDRVDLSNLEQLHTLAINNDLDAGAQPIVQAVWYLLNYAFENRVSDIHVEPKRDESWVRMRIDGVLHRIHRLPKAVHAAVISRFKTLSRLDIAERRRPQDGRFKTRYQHLEVELRVSTAPTAFGEKLVARIFDPGILIQDIEHIGFFERERQAYKQMIQSNNGLVLVVGPTGSGKTTTLYSSLHYLASPRSNIISLEDPIEMVHEKFNQIAIQPKIDLTFGNALRTVLRQDPDVVMVGEIRDEDTAQNVVQAAMTGHMVLSTIHTGDSAGAVGRMLDLNVMPFLLSSVLVGVVAQRLVRRICPHCKIDSYLSDEQIHALRIQGARGRRLKVKKGKGCLKCRYTGYLGRTGLFEVLAITPRIQRLIDARASSQEIMREGINDGMLTLREYGIKKIAAGETTFEEVMSLTDDRVLY